MSRISEVFYSEIDTLKQEEVADFYYHYNLIGESDVFHKTYIDYEEKNISVKNKILGDAYKTGKIPKHPKMNKSLIGISTLKNKPVIIVEY